MTTRAVDEYLALPYTIEVVRDDSDGEVGYVAKVVELPGCFTQADSFEELGEMIEDAMRAWIETAIEDGQPIPEPRPVEAYSGKFVVRLPRSLHRELAQAAEREGVSLNALISNALAHFLGASSKNPSNESQTMRPHPAPHWPSLSEAAHRAMSAAGLDVEAQQIDEQLFGGWLEGQLQQVEAAFAGGYVQDAKGHVLHLIQALHGCKNNSPIMSVLHRMAVLLADQFEESVMLREGIVQSHLVQARVQSQVSMTSRAVLRRISTEHEERSKPESTPWDQISHSTLEDSVPYQLFFPV